MVSRVPSLNLMRRLDRLDSTRIQGSPPLQASPPLTFAEGFDVVENSSRSNRSILTEKEVEAIRTARVGGESVLSIAKRFGIHRATVWEHIGCARVARSSAATCLSFRRDQPRHRIN